MTRHDPVAEDDHLIEELLAGRVADDPVLAGLAAWRTGVTEGAPATPREDPAGAGLVQASTEPLVATGRTLPHGGDVRAARSAAAAGARRHRAGRAGVRTRRVGSIGLGAAVLLAMGVGQAVAGNPVAPFTYVVARAVGFGEGVATPKASDARAPLTSPTPSDTPRFLHGGRAGAEALTSTREDDVATSAPPKSERGRSDAPGTDDPPTTAPDPAPRTDPTPVPGPTDPAPTSPAPDHPHPSDPGDDEHGDHDRGRSRGDDSDRDRGWDHDDRDHRVWRPWYVVN